MSRESIYYWKCDRASAFHGIRGHRTDESPEDLSRLLEEELRTRLWPEGLELAQLSSQGNHRLWRASTPTGEFLVRVEDGPERDDYQMVESRLLDRVRETGVPTPAVAGGDATRERVPFAWQALEWVPHPDLQHWHAKGELDLAALAPEIGRAVARWQSVAVSGFGPFCSGTFSRTGELRGFHASYAGYFRLRLDRHLGLLTESGFLSAFEAARIDLAVRDHEPLLDLAQACLVHKDLALWNILGARDRIAAFIDFDDAVAGDPMDDLSLLACFHPRETVDLAVEGYRSLRPLPPEWERRLHLHTLRNLIVKSVIRVGAGYFERDEGLFLIGAGSSGPAFRTETHRRLTAALASLES